MEQQKPKISCVHNGPYFLPTDVTPKVVVNIRNSRGEPCSTVGEVALCRCGGSHNKPFCDGTHEKIGFTDEKQLDRVPDKRTNYIGKRVTIHDNRGICAHSRHCTDNLPTVFDVSKDPWIDPFGASDQEIIDTVKKCPSGALSYTVDGVEHRDQEREAMLTVTKDGPYEITGGIELMEQPLGEGASTEHYSLCRCGASRNKPFCDGAHLDIGFKDEKN